MARERTKIEKLETRDAAERIWQRRRAEPGVIASCFVLHSEKLITPKHEYPEDWRVYTVYPS
jgi:hypothetical protein